jgi:REP element-mobilizing transposase RayT
MRQARIKIPAAECEAVYHCISRTVNGEWLFDGVAKEILRRQLWQVADFCGVQIATYVILSNHFHILVRVPQEQAVSDVELLRRYRSLYRAPTNHQMARLQVIETQLVHSGPEAIVWRRQQLALMGDVSQFMKLLKQRFSIWFNKSHRRFGTLWAERFKSVLVEPDGRSLQTIAAYIDLNCVRAGLVKDPKDYRFCGYAEAVAGNQACQDGLKSVIGGQEWCDTQSEYREILFGTGAGARDAAVISAADLQRVIATGGNLPLFSILRCRLRYLTDGAILGSRVFVEAELIKYRKKTGCRQSLEPRPLPACTDWGDLRTLRGFRLRRVG